MTSRQVSLVFDRVGSPQQQSRLMLLVLALSLATASSGCVHRRMTIRTNPPGAAVYVDDYPIGTTPVSTSFVYYGTRKIRIVKDGYETLTVQRKISPPWYQYFPLDFVSENLVPTEIRDERMLDFTLSPQMIAPTDQLIGRAEQLRQSGRGGGVMLTGAEVPFGPQQSELPLPGQLPPPQLGSEPVPSTQALPPGASPPVVIQPLPPTGQPTLPSPGTQPVPVPGPSLNPFSRPTVPPPTPGLPPPGAYPQQ